VKGKTAKLKEHGAERGDLTAKDAKGRAGWFCSEFSSKIRPEQEELFDAGVASSLRGGDQVEKKGDI
jgi:hypothetical protein